MLSNTLIAPSINSLFFTGILILSLFIIILRNFRQILQFKLYDKLTFLCLFTIAIGIHGIIHLGAEQYYGFNPYKWI